MLLDFSVFIAATIALDTSPFVWNYCVVSRVVSLENNRHCDTVEKLHRKD